MSSASPSSSSSSSSSFSNSNPVIQEFQETILKNLNAAHEEVRKANEGTYPEGLAEKVKSASENIFQHQLIKNVIEKYFNETLSVKVFNLPKEAIKLVILNSSMDLVSGLYEAIRVISRAKSSKTDSFPGDRAAVNYSVVLESSKTLAKFALNPLEPTASLTTAAKASQSKITDLLRGKAILGTHISIAEEIALRGKKIKPEQVLDQEYLSGLPSYLDGSSFNLENEKEVEEIGNIILKNLVEINGIVRKSKASTYPGDLASRVSIVFQKIFPYLELGMVIQQFVRKYVELQSVLGKIFSLDKETFTQLIAENNLEFVSHLTTELKSMLKDVVVKLEIDMQAGWCILGEFNQTLEALAQNSLEISDPESIAVRANQASLASYFKAQTPPNSASMGISSSSSSSSISSSSSSAVSENNRIVKEMLVREVGYVLDNFHKKYNGRSLEKFEKQTLNGLEYIFRHPLILKAIEEFVQKNQQEIFQRVNKEPVLYPFLEILFIVTIPKIRSTDDQYQKIVDDGEGTVNLIVDGELESFQEHNRTRMTEKGIRLFGKAITSNFDDEKKTPLPVQPSLVKSSSSSAAPSSPSPSVPPTMSPQLNKSPSSSSSSQVPSLSLSPSSSSISPSSASPKTNVNSKDKEIQILNEKHESTIITGLEHLLTVVKKRYEGKDHAADVTKACDEIFNYTSIKQAIRDFVQKNRDDAMVFCAEVGDSDCRHLADGIEGRFNEGATFFMRVLVTKVIPEAIVEYKKEMAAIDFEMQSLVASELKKCLAEAESKLKGAIKSGGETKQNK